MCEAISTDATTADWYFEKGAPNGGRELRRIWDKAGEDGEQGKRRRNTLALVSFITDQEEWQDTLAINLLTETIEIAMHLPSTTRCEQRPLVDADVLEAMLYFQARGFPKATKGAVLDALTVIASRNSYHPVRDYLSGLKWDGVGRVRRLFLGYFKADLPTLTEHPFEDEQSVQDRHVKYLEEIAECFMVSAVARVMQAGCKVDHAPVLIGPQGLLKSTAVRALCHDPAWFTDDISPNLIERDTKESLRGKWIIELAEIPHVRREAERVKAFFTRRDDRYREAYGMLNRDHPRQCVFIGTTNDLEFVDVTGNRRFWPVRLTETRTAIGRIEADREQLWAEAVSLYHQGRQWWLADNIEAIAASVQDAFTETDLWEAPIGRWAADQSAGFTMEDLFAASTGFMPFREATAATKADQMRAGRCLTKLHYVKRLETRDGRRTVWWQRKTQSVWK
jgi:predicted P-loop ATPase